MRLNVAAHKRAMCATICDAHTSMNERILHVLKLEPHDHAIRVAYVVCTEHFFSPVSSFKNAPL